MTIPVFLLLYFVDILNSSFDENAINFPENLPPRPNAAGKFLRSCLQCLPCLGHKILISGTDSLYIIPLEAFIEIVDSARDVFFYGDLTRDLSALRISLINVIETFTPNNLLFTYNLSVDELASAAHNQILTKLNIIIARYESYFMLAKPNVKDSVDAALNIHSLISARDELDAFVKSPDEIEDFEKAARGLEVAISEVVNMLGFMIKLEPSGRCMTGLCRKCGVKGY